MWWVFFISIHLKLSICGNYLINPFILCLFYPIANMEHQQRNSTVTGVWNKPNYEHKEECSEIENSGYAVEIFFSDDTIMLMWLLLSSTLDFCVGWCCFWLVLVSLPPINSGARISLSRPIHFPVYWDCRAWTISYIGHFPNISVDGMTKIFSSDCCYGRQGI